MATAYAALTSLMHLTRALRDHPEPPIRLDDDQFDSLSSKFSLFQRFLEGNHSTIDPDLDIRIADSAHAVEDLIETHIADRANDFRGALQRAIEGLDLITMEMNQMEQNRGSNDQRTRSHMPLAPSRRPSTGENIVVGLEDMAINIISKLTSPQNKSAHQIIAISGMGGIGKTTLAQKVYEHRYTKNYFDFFAWATISKDCNTHESLVELIHSLDKKESKESLRETSEHLLGEHLYKYLFDRRYLVILDDLWDLKSWDRLRSFFPSCSGSGIVITTRESAVGAAIGSHSFRVDLLDEHKSWEIFCKNVFGHDSSCPFELEDIGKEISKRCRGLPLSIVVIASHLAKSPRTREYWENTAQNLSSVVNSEDNERCLKILSLSYSNLPVHLKPCFLYMAVFSEDQVIDVPRLVRLWVAEGFVKPINGKSLEEAAKDYLNDLVARNLILGCELSVDGGLKSCKIHDLLRDFCIKESSKTKFLRIVQKRDDVRAVNNERRLVVHPIASKDEMDLDCHLDTVVNAQAFLRSLIFEGTLPPLGNDQMLRVLAPADDRLVIDYSLVEILDRLVKLRCLECWLSVNESVDQLPSSIFRTWNLQHLTIRNVTGVTAPAEIWKMTQLRHIDVEGLVLPRPPGESNGDVIIMENLRSARIIRNLILSEEAVKRIPNIKDLTVHCRDAIAGYDEATRTLSNVDRLEKLESFACLVMAKNDTDLYYKLRNVTLPLSLKKLHIGKLRWDDVTSKIASLPLLEELILEEIRGHEWDLDDDEGRQFVKLKLLTLSDCPSLLYFTASNSHFPSLQLLFLSELESLTGISLEIGDIETLESIEVFDCPDEAVVSAKEIADEQNENGNEELRVTATFFALALESSLSESISTRNFRVKFV